MGAVDTFLKDKLGVSLGDIKEAFTTIATKVKPVTDALKTMGGVYLGAWKEIWDIVSMIFNGDWEGLKQKFYGIFGSIGTFIADAIKVALNSGIALVEKTLNTVLDNIIKTVNKIPGVNLAVPSVELPRFATGGYVSGAGTGTSDSIPALLSNGEFVINAAATRALGKDALEMVNNGKLPAFANGGAVNRWTQRPKTTSSPSTTEEPISLGEETAKAFRDDFQSGFSDFIKTGDFKSFATGLADSFSGKIIDNFASGFTDMLFDGGMDLLGGLFGGGGGLGSSIGGLFSGGLGGIFGFSKGGLVPSTPYSKLGQDSVPAMLTPGEVVVPVNEVGKQGGGATINLKIVGDVSMQTRKEVLTMMEDITDQVNSINKERG
jgi:hypothetical protein